MRIDEVSTSGIGGGRAHAREDAMGGGLLNFGQLKRLPTILQTEGAECGLACLAMIANYHRNHISLAELRLRYPVSIKGSTLDRLMNIASGLGLSSRPVRVELSQMNQLHTPCVLHWNLNHFVVLKGIRKGKARIHDPAVGDRSITLDELGSSFTGVALELAPGPEFKRKPAREPLSLRALSGSIQGIGRALGQIFAMAAVLELLALLAPQFIEIAVDQVMSDRDIGLLTILGMAFSLILAAQVCITAMRTWTVTWIGTQFNLAWSGNVFQHLLRLPHDYFLKRHLGDIVSRFGSITTIQQTITTKFVEAILDGIMAVVTIIMLYVYSPILATVTSSSVFAYGVLRLLYYRVFRESNLSQVVNMARQQGTLMESMRGVQTLRIYNLVPSRTARFLNQTADVLNASIFVQRLTMIFDAINALLSGGQRIAVIWVGAWLASDGKISAGMLMAYLAYAEQFTTRAIGFIDYSIQIRLLRIQGERLADIVLTPIEEDVSGNYVGSLEHASVSMRQVSYRYSPSDPWVLKDCDMHVNDGEFVAIVGPSGCGKSTLARLILGLLDADSGTISFGGVDMRHLGKQSAREIISSVMQDDQLFSGTIAENISLFDPNATSEAIEAAARSAQIHDDVRRMPMSYFSLIGDMGSSLSGGQQQRLLLARAIYRRPRILILDEATSQLDILRERAIAEHLREIKVTRIVIAHRPETIRSADRVLELRDGRLVEVSNCSMSEIGG
ncbi:ATP-binding cassette, subfamily B, RaxB [Luteibacter sp. 22Crub2.1]|nr:ATP-binding cassette, subfamily B, RaxB [Luteibacter sp. 22Crub2.1]